MELVLARTLIFATLLALPASVSLQEGPSDADWDWVNARFPSVLDELLPLPKHRQVDVAYRSHRDLYTEVLEYSFVISQRPGEKLRADVREADGVSMYNQIMALHRQAPGMPIDTLKKELRVKVRSVTEDGCPALRQRLREFYRVRFRPPKTDLIILHPMVYEIRSIATLGDMDLVLVDDAHPLVHWALETRSALAACTSKLK